VEQQLRVLGRVVELAAECVAEVAEEVCEVHVDICLALFRRLESADFGLQGIDLFIERGRYGASRSRAFMLKDRQLLLLLAERFRDARLRLRRRAAGAACHTDDREHEEYAEQEQGDRRDEPRPLPVDVAAGELAG